MEIGKVLHQQDVEGIPKPTFEGAVEVQFPNADVDAAAKYAVDAYNKEQGSNLEFVSILVGWRSPVPDVGTFYHIFLKAKDGGKTKVYLAVVLTTPEKKLLLRFIYIFG